jgi:hypothetical protein
MIGLQPMPSQNKLFAFGSSGGIYVISSTLEQRTEPILQSKLEQITDVR